MLKNFFFYFKNYIALVSQYRSLMVVFYFLFILVLGMTTFTHYGMSADELISRTNGGMSLNYIADKFNITWLKNDPILATFNIPLNEYYDRDYGVAFDLPAFFIERLFSLNDSRQQFLLRHAFTFLVFWAGLIAIYHAAKLRFNHWGYALLASTLLLTTPRLYGEAFFNNKDIVFMACFAASLYTLTRLRLTLSWQSVFLHALMIAITINIRIAGVIFFGLTIFMLVMLCSLRVITVRNCLTLTAVFGVTCALGTYGMWPWLWENPFTHFLIALKNMSQFRWDYYNLYFGEYVFAKNIPWHYAPTWIALTTPLLISLCFVIGILKLGMNVASHPWQSFKRFDHFQDFLFLAVAGSPIFAAIVLNSTLYDGWRQLYFIYPAMILLSISGLQALNTKHVFGLPVAGLMVLLFSLQILFNVSWMIRHHPFQHLYFNGLVTLFSSQNSFERDYWGVTDVKGLEFILANDARNRLTIRSLGVTSVQQAIELLKPEDRKRMILDRLNVESDYILTNYRFFDGLKFEQPDKAYAVFYEIVVDGGPVLTIYRRLSTNLQ
jgi:hypothetical protein